MKRTLRYIPEIEGCYGMRVWIPVSDKDLTAFIRPISIWGSATAQRFAPDKTEFEFCYELPFGIEKNELWVRACRFFNIEWVH